MNARHFGIIVPIGNFRRVFDELKSGLLPGRGGCHPSIFDLDPNGRAFSPIGNQVIEIGLQGVRDVSFWC